MRGYFFTNFYMSSIQKGVQSLHCAVDICFKYQPNTPQYKTYKDWATNHKTVILLNGGNCADLGKIFDIIAAEANPSFGIHHLYPFGLFREDNQSLNDALTCVGIILPESVYTLAEYVRRDPTVLQLAYAHSRYIKVDENPLKTFDVPVTRSEIILADLLSKHSLAN